jgi:hypothetical protein
MTILRVELTRNQVIRRVQLHQGLGWILFRIKSLSNPKAIKFKRLSETWLTSKYWLTNIEDVRSAGCLWLDGQELQVAVSNSNPG